MVKELKLFFLAVIIVIAAAGCRPQNIATGPDGSLSQNNGRLRVMTFNILNLYAGKGRTSPWVSDDNQKTPEAHLDEISAAIRSADPDIIGLQEVNGEAQARYIAKQLNMNFAYIDHEDPNFTWGLAVLSRYRILSVKGAPIHPVSYRRALLSEIEIAGTKVMVVNLHFQKADHADQVNRTMDLVKDHQGPLILLGSVNLQYADEKIGPIRTAFVDTCTAIQSDSSARALSIGTYPRRDWRSDYIFVDAGHFQVLDAGIVDPAYRYASDHIAYWADLAVK